MRKNFNLGVRARRMSVAGLCFIRPRLRRTGGFQLPARTATRVGELRHAATAIVAGFILAASAGTALAQTTERVSVATGGTQGDAYSRTGSISADGRFVAFYSLATNLVSGDTNSKFDIFVHDRQTGTTERVNVATGGGQADDDSYNPAISADGRFVAFESNATDLVSGDTNGVRDVFVHDRQTGTTERVNVATGGGEANNGSYTPAISADGRFVAFYSDATNLVSGDTNGTIDIFVHDRQTGTTERVSVATNGDQATGGDSFGPAISADGRFVAFESDATNLVSGGGDSNGNRDIFVHDRQTGTTERVSVATGGGQADSGSFLPAISADGRFVAFQSTATNLVSGDNNGDPDIFVHDRQTGTTERVSVATGGTEATGYSYSPAISADGRFVAFYSYAADLVGGGGDTNGKADVFVHDRQTGTTERVSVATGGTEAIGGDSAIPAIGADGRFVAFYSYAANLVSGDSNSAPDIFVRDRGTSGAAPLAPLALNATNVGDSAFTANFTGQDATAAGYRIDVATSSSFASVGAAADGPADFVPGYQSRLILCVPNPCTPGTVSLNVSGVQPGTQEYYYRVQAWGRGGDSPFSDTVLANPPADDTPTPPPPQSKTAIGPLELLALSLLAFAGLGLRARRA